MPTPRSGIVSLERAVLTAGSEVPRKTVRDPGDHLEGGGRMSGPLGLVVLTRVLVLLVLLLREQVEVIEIGLHFVVVKFVE